MSSRILPESLERSPGTSSDEECGCSSDPLSRLPLELAHLILGYLSAEHLFTASLVCKAWQGLVNSDSLWKRICIQHDLSDENFPFEFGGVTGTSPDATRWCRWAHIYRTLLRRQRKWEFEETINLSASNSANCFGAHGTTLAIGNVDGNITVHSNVGHDLIPVQKIELRATVRDVRVALNTIVCLIDDWAAVLRFEDGKFKTEAIFDPEQEHRHDRLSDLENTNEGPRQKTRTLLISHDSVWFATSALKIYRRSSRTFMRHEATHIIDAKQNHDWVAILRPDSVDLFRHSGVQEYSICDEFFYTGLVMSSCAVAFLESPDFGDPVATVVNLSTRKKLVLDSQIPAKLKVYKLALYRDTTFCLNGQEKFCLSCHSHSGNIKWIVPLPGSKYLRPGKDFFKVICSKFIFLSPAQVRLDVFDLYDMDSGNKLYTVSIHTSSYNICQVSDAGLTVQISACRARIGGQGNLVSWISLA